MSELSWRDAIIRVLQASPEAMHYTEIAEAILAQKLKTDVGATPAASAGATITVSLKSEKDASPFVRVERGRYTLRAAPKGKSVIPVTGAAEEDETGLINAFGMYWERAKVRWTTTPRILGRQAKGSTVVDFCGQQGVYLLYDRRSVVYVGRTTNQPLGVRLQQHDEDRLSGRWERFSWFGVYPVTEAGPLKTDAVGTYDLSTLIVTMEALLIEGLEPPLNRKRGDGFKAIEFLQVEDEEIQKRRALDVLEGLKTKL